MLRGWRQKNERKGGGLGLAQGVEQVLVWRPEKWDFGVQPTIACLSFIESLAAHECLLFSRCRPHPVGDESGLSLLCATCWYGPGFSPKSPSQPECREIKSCSHSHQDAWSQFSSGYWLQFPIDPTLYVVGLSGYSAHFLGSSLPYVSLWYTHL